MQENREKLITENMRLVYHVIHRYFPTYAHDEDIIQVGMIGLCIAAERWDSTKAKFTTFATNVIRNEIRKEFRRNSKQIKTVSLDVPREGEYCDDMSMYDVLPGDPDVDYDPSEEFAKMLMPKDRECFEALMQGSSQRDIAKDWNVAVNTVFQRTRRIRKVWEEEYGNPDKVSR